MVPRFPDHPRQVRAVVDAIRRATDASACVRRTAKSIDQAPRRPAVIAVGKAASAMYSGWRESMDDPARHFMVAPEGVDTPIWSMRGEHPLPGEKSVAAARSLAEFVQQCNAATDIDGFVVLLSGGASSLLTWPMEGVSLTDLRDVTKRLMESGADIKQLNTMRKHLERLKGGRLAMLMVPKPVLVLSLSDVIGDDPSVVASGPLSPDASTYAEALKIVESLGKHDENSAIGRIKQSLGKGVKGEQPETPKPGDQPLRHVRYVYVGSNTLALEAAKSAVEGLGFNVAAMRAGVVGAAGDVGKSIAQAAVKQRGTGQASALLVGGETTVRVKDRAAVNEQARGGRNQELALAGAVELDGVDEVMIASFATDGVDGPTDAAGAFVTGRTCLRARSLGLDAKAALASHDSYGFFHRLESAGQPHHIKTGPTGTNVNDVSWAFVYPKGW